MPDAPQSENLKVQVDVPEEPCFKDAVRLTLEPEDAEWLLNKAKDEYVEFLKAYPEVRNYHQQQRAERIAEALGKRLTMFNNGDNTYSISQSDMSIDK